MLLDKIYSMENISIAHLTLGSADLSQENISTSRQHRVGFRTDKCLW